MICSWARGIFSSTEAICFCANRILEMYKTWVQLLSSQPRLKHNKASWLKIRNLYQNTYKGQSSRLASSVCQLSRECRCQVFCQVTDDITVDMGIVEHMAVGALHIIYIFFH